MKPLQAVFHRIRGRKHRKCLIEFPLNWNKSSCFQFKLFSLRLLLFCLLKEHCKQLFMLLNYFEYQNTNFSSAKHFSVLSRSRKFSIFFPSLTLQPVAEVPLHWNANLKTWVIYSILCAQFNHDAFLLRRRRERWKSRQAEASFEFYVLAHVSIWSFLVLLSCINCIAEFE